MISARSLAPRPRGTLAGSGVVLRDVQFVRHKDGQDMRLSTRSYDVLRIDFCDPSQPLPACPADANDDDFYDDSAFSDPQVIASLSAAK